MAKFITIGERLSVTAPTVNKAFAARDEEPILKRAKQQLDAIYQNDEKSWREMSITEFVDSLVSKLASVSVS